MSRTRAPRADRQRPRGPEPDRSTDLTPRAYAAALAPRGVASTTWTPLRRVLIPPPGIERGRPAAQQSPRLERLLDDAATVSGVEIQRLAVHVRHARRTTTYAEALLAIRRAAERSGRGEAVSRAGAQAEHLIASAARAESPSGLEDRALWSVVVTEAAWGAGDAARALVVSDLLATAELDELTSAWNAARIGRD